MSRQPFTYTDQELAELAKRFDQWRAARASRREPIPQPLWDDAVRLSQRLPISCVAKALRLSGGELKRQRERAAARSKPTVARAAPNPLPYLFRL